MNKLNIFTEDEAKTKWCPFVRYLAIFRDDEGNRECAGSFNRGAQDSSTNTAPCLASGCMMWRKTDQIGIDPNGRKVDRDMDGRTRWVDQGFCGLAGQPSVQQP